MSEGKRGPSLPQHSLLSPHSSDWVNWMTDYTRSTGALPRKREIQDNFWLLFSFLFTMPVCACLVFICTHTSKRVARVRINPGRLPIRIGSRQKKNAGGSRESFMNCHDRTGNQRGGEKNHSWMTNRTHKQVDNTNWQRPVFPPFFYIRSVA